MATIVIVVMACLDLTRSWAGLAIEAFVQLRVQRKGPDVVSSGDSAFIKQVE